MTVRKPTEKPAKARSAASGRFIQDAERLRPKRAVVVGQAKSFKVANVQRSIRHARIVAYSSVLEVFHGSPMEILEGMRTGAPADIVPNVAHRLGISQDRLFESLNLPKSTLKGRIRDNKPLAPIEQDRIYRAERVMNRAIDVLGDEAAAREWIIRENRSLGGQAPLALMDTEYGYEMVLDTLGRIEYGVFS
jgi:putative toxin-antitoxin system antitoxin component (TIGR02293 family)